MPSDRMKQLLSDIEKQGEMTRELAEDYKAIFNSERGKKIFNDLARRFGWMAPSFRPDMSRVDDPRILINEGAKMPIAHIDFMVRVDPNVFATRIQIKENTHEGRLRTNNEG